MFTLTTIAPGPCPQLDTVHFDESYQLALHMSANQIGLDRERDARQIRWWLEHSVPGDVFERAGRFVVTRCKSYVNSG